MIFISLLCSAFLFKVSLGQAPQPSPSCTVNGRASNIRCTSDPVPVCGEGRRCEASTHFCCDPGTGSGNSGGGTTGVAICPTGSMAQMNGPIRCTADSACALNYYCYNPSYNGKCCTVPTRKTTMLDSCPANYLVQTDMYGKAKTCSPTAGSGSGLNQCNYPATCLYSASGSGNHICCKSSTSTITQARGNYGQQCALYSNQCYDHSVCQNGYCTCMQNEVWDPINKRCDRKGYLNGMCAGRYNDECYDRSVCRNQRCSCPPDEYYDQRDDRCMALPGIGASCDWSMMQRPCADPNAECIYDSTSTVTGRCQCNKHQCFEEVSNKCVRKRLKLDEACTSDCQCMAAFSTCDTTTKKCTCRPGFNKKVDVCDPAARNCPFDKPLSGTNGVVECEMSRLPYPAYPYGGNYPANYAPGKAKDNKNNGKQSRRKRQTVQTVACASDVFTDNCADGYYCVAYGNDPMKQIPYYNYNMQSDIKIKGFCCKQQDPKCPVGEPHSSSKAPAWGCDNCPSTHYCHLDGHATKIQICCPKQCQAETDIMVAGKCYAEATYGEACEVTEQCDSVLKCQDYGGTKECGCPNPDHIFDPNRKQCVAPSCYNGGMPFKDSHNHMILCSTSSLYASGSNVPVRSCPVSTQCDMQYGICCSNRVENSQCSLFRSGYVALGGRAEYCLSDSQCRNWHYPNYGAICYKNTCCGDSRFKI